MNNAKPKLIAIVGTNASGKSGLGIRMAARFHGEVISADSRQVFKGLDLGSGKVTPDEMMGVPHHLIDIAAPNDFFSMYDFQRLAYQAIDETIARKNIPFLVGGTGLYVASVTEGYVMSERKLDLEYRTYLETFSTPDLYAMLLKAQPDTTVEPKNRNRVMRVLEKIHDGDEGHTANDPHYDVLKIGVTWPREELAARIDERLERRVRQGMLEEVKTLMDNGASIEFLRKLGLEYRFITEYLLGEIPSREEMLRLLAIAIKQFAKRQMTWFRRDPQIHWLDMAHDPDAQAATMIQEFLDK